MLRILKSSAAFVLSAAACVASAYAQSDPIVIYDASTPAESARPQGVTVTKLDDGSLQIVDGKDDPWPGVHFEGEWDLSAYDGLDVTIQSTSKAPFTLYFRMDCKATDLNTREGSITLHETFQPGETKTWRVDFPATLNQDVREKLFAMRGKPGGITTDGKSQDSKRSFDKGTLTALRPFICQDKADDSWILKSIVAVPAGQKKIESEAYLHWPPEKFFPMIDEFGQFMHKDWPGKTHSLEELRAQVALEDADLAAHQPTGLDEYGGWQDGPQLEATGSFRVEKVDGVWYFVDPNGRLFWSNGVDCVGTSNAWTPLSDREFYFSDKIPMKPAKDNPLSQFLAQSDHSVNNYYEGYGPYWQYNFSASNLYLKYGDDWQAKTKERVQRRLRSWGLNTIGNWSDIELLRGSKTPYVVCLGTAGPRIQGSEGYWGKFVDPFTDEFAHSVEKSFQSRAWTADDPYNVGYFVDNEIAWGEAGSLAKAALASPKDQPVKIEYVKRLKEKYGTIEKFNAAWQVQLASWDALADKPFQSPKNSAADEDNNAFYTEICEKYFSAIRDSLRKLAPNKLYLGCRFAWTNELARAAGQKYCDVVSYNFYKRSVEDFTPVEGPDKPVIIGEFHFGALDRGLFHTGLVPCKDQNERADAYEKYVAGALANPWIVGAHWFQYGDEAVTGRFDGENYQIGLVDVCDTPYPETIAACRRVGYKAYEIRKNAKPAK